VVVAREVYRISLMGSKCWVLSMIPVVAVVGDHPLPPSRPVLEGVVGIALAGDLTARSPSFCLHHFVDDRPKILTAFVP
jgi:hypothetical protein